MVAELTVQLFTLEDTMEDSLVGRKALGSLPFVSMTLNHGPLILKSRCFPEHHRKFKFLLFTTMCPRTPRWSTADENLLATLRCQYPQQTWEELAALFNLYVPIDRWRSSDSLKKKATKNKLNRFK